MSSATIGIEHAPEGLYTPPRARRRNLGGAVVLAAIDDYRSLDEEAHADAAGFLYPRTADEQEDFDWAVAVGNGIDGLWLREMLDRWRLVWDGERMRKAAGRRRRTGSGCGR